MSAEFQSFVDGNKINHVTTPAYHHSSNGMAERAIQTLKRGLRKNNVKPNNFQEHVDEYLRMDHATPNQNGVSPSELCLDRRINISLDLTRPTNTIKGIDINGRIRKLKIDDHVLVKNEVRGKRILRNFLVNYTTR